jgi:hypothetical protein
MELINATRMTAGFNMGLEPSGRELLVVVVKGTFVLPEAGAEVRLHTEQLPLILADSFSGEPGFSAPLQEADYAPRKSACEVLLTGTVRAPAGRQVTRMRAGVRVGTMEKAFDVVGHRVWQAGLTGIAASSPQPFTEMPVSYDNAFGGADRCSENEAEHDAYLFNPVGCGWHKHLKNAWVDGTPLPNTEEIGKVVSHPSNKYRPMSLGPLGRGWPQRARHAGTYDDEWRANVFPFLPADFDERFYQAAPVDQQLAHSREPLQVVLSGFTPDGARHFTLPGWEAPVRVFPKRGDREDLLATLDTIVFEPDFGRFTMSWRVARPLRSSLHDIAQVVVGEKGRAWWQQRERVATVAPRPIAEPDVSRIG